MSQKVLLTAKNITSFGQLKTPRFYRYNIRNSARGVLLSALKEILEKEYQTRNST
jgi:hypothetical protein